MFATPNAVKQLNGSFATTKNDQALGLVVDGVNAKIIAYLDRELIIGDYTDTYDVLPTKTVTYTLRAYPVNSITEVRLDGEVIPSDYYLVNKTTGRIQMKFEQPLGVGILEVDYNGGLAVDETALRAELPEVAYSANMQSIFEFQRKESIVANSKQISGGGSETYQKYGLLKETVRVLRKHRRYRLVA